MSQVLNYGKFWMYDKYIVPGGCPPYPYTPNHEISRAEFEMFHVHGDPTMQIRTAFPQNPTVDHPERTPMIPHILQVAVSVNNTPVEGALVLVTQGDNLYIRNLTDASGNAYLDIDPPTNENLTVIVTGNNCLHYSGSIIVNVLPEIPCRPSGETRGETGREYLYTTSTTDLDGEHIFYNFSWGDGTYSGWVGPFDSGAVASATHAWNEGWKTYEIKVKAMDTCGEESDWSDPFSITMPRNQRLSGLFFNIVEQFFPRLFSIFDNIINR
ncbi:unnamed protein product [marine sediment metagenome]|uniref:PKD domain-containing protein n=1 Tax=marine sediment metagenome TaxID=412755 RepID=X1FYQ1_9ZZZZ